MKKITITTAHLGIAVIIAAIMIIACTVKSEIAVSPKVNKFEELRGAVVASMDEEKIEEALDALKNFCEEESLNEYTGEINEVSEKIEYLEHVKEESDRYMSELQAYKEMISECGFETVPYNHLYKEFGALDWEVAAGIWVAFGTLAVAIGAVMFDWHENGFRFKVLLEYEPHKEVQQQLET